MSLRFRLATPADFPRITAMLRAFYAEDHIAFDPALVEPGLRALLAEPAHGAVLLLQSDDVAAEIGVKTVNVRLGIAGDRQDGRFHFQHVAMREKIANQRVQARALV